MVQKYEGGGLMRPRANRKLRRDIKDLGLYCWEVADEMGVSEATFFRRLRHPLTPEGEVEIRRAMRTIHTRRTDGAYPKAVKGT